ncbi:hypothetical protein ACHAWF_007706, partial [Thalassiosira exigua]
MATGRSTMFCARMSPMIASPVKKNVSNEQRCDGDVEPKLEKGGPPGRVSKEVVERDAHVKGTQAWEAGHEATRLHFYGALRSDAAHQGQELTNQVSEAISNFVARGDIVWALARHAMIPELVHAATAEWGLTLRPE